MSETSGAVPGRNGAGWSRPTRRELAALALLAVVLAGSLSFVLATWRIPRSADQAVVGLMALDILQGKGHPVFYYGATYAGSLEAHGVALAFALFGASPVVYRAAMTFLVLLIVAGVWALTRWMFGPRAALLGAAYLVLPPFFFLYKGLTSDGHYASAQIIALAVLASAHWRHGRLARGDSGSAPLLAFGFAGGVGIWVTPVSPPVVAAALLWLLLCGDLKPYIRPLLAIAAGGVLGSFPWWFWNIRHGWASVFSSDVGLVDASGLLRNLGGVARSSLAILTGAGQVFRVPPSGLLFPGAWPISGILLLVVLLPLAGREMRKDSRVVLFVLAGAFVLLAGAASRRFVAFEPRFFVTLYAVLPPLVGASLARVSWWGRKGAVAVVALSGVLAMNAGSLFAARTQEVVLQEKEVTGGLEELLSALTAREIDRVYASYWIAYRVAFETKEKVIATPLRRDDMVRIGEYEAVVDRAPGAALVLLPPTAGCFESYLLEQKSPFEKTTAAAFSVFSGLSAETLGVLRAARSVPLPSGGRRAEWTVLSHPGEMQRGASARVVLQVRNQSPCSWSPAIAVGSSWVSSGGNRFEVPGRFFLPRRVSPGESFRAELSVNAPKEPGRYVIEYGVLQENVPSSGRDGGSLLRVPVLVP